MMLWVVKSVGVSSEQGRGGRMIRRAVFEADLEPTTDLVNMAWESFFHRLVAPPTKHNCRTCQCHVSLEPSIYIHPEHRIYLRLFFLLAKVSFQYYYTQAGHWPYGC